MNSSLLVYILLMIVVTNLIRIIPVTLIRGRIRNRFVRSFLYYVPYVTLAVMTVPAIVDAASTPFAGIMALALGIVAAWYGMGLFPVAIICCVIVFLLGLI